MFMVHDRLHSSGPGGSYPHLFSRGELAGVQLRNRIVLAPMTAGHDSNGARVTPSRMEYHVLRAQEGVALDLVAGAAVSPEGRVVENQFLFNDDEVIREHLELTEHIHLMGAKAALQLFHAGRQTNPSRNGGYLPLAPSGVACPINKVVPAEMSHSDIARVVESFGAAARRARLAGYDMCMLHAAHGYLLGQFLSSYANRRSDEYGGVRENRVRIVRACLEAIRKEAGADFPVILSLSAEEGVTGGLDPLEAAAIARLLESEVDAFYVSAGVAETMNLQVNPMREQEGPKVGYAALVRSVVSKPVIAVGVIRSPAFADQVIAEGKADFVALGRQLLADSSWPRKARAGRENAIRPCLSCNDCFGAERAVGSGFRCSVNPVAGRESDWGSVVPAPHRKRVAVVGAGPAGMECARTLAARGHEVILWERKDRIGGHLLLAGRVPGKERLKEYISWCERKIASLPIDVRLGIHVEQNALRDLSLDVLVVAAGSQSVVPDFPVAEDARVMSALEVLAGADVSGREVVVLGGRGPTAIDVMRYLLHEGCRVTCIQRSPREDFGAGLCFISRLFEPAELQARVRLLAGYGVTEVGKNAVVVTDSDGRPQSIKTDLVVLALGLRSNAETAGLGESIAASAFVIGDARRVGNIMSATYDGAYVARRI